MSTRDRDDRSVGVLIESHGKVMAMAFPERRMLQRWLRDHPGYRVVGPLGRRRAPGTDSRPVGPQDQAEEAGATE